MTRDKKTYIGIMVAVLIAAAIIILLDEINLPLPESDKGLLTLDARIASCEIGRLGRAIDNEYYIHLAFDSPIARRISHNFNAAEKSFYERICETRSVVNVKYYAVRSLLNPTISYWVKELNEQ